MHSKNLRNGKQNNQLRKFDYECKQRDSQNTLLFRASYNRLTFVILRPSNCVKENLVTSAFLHLSMKVFS